MSKLLTDTFNVNVNHQSRLRTFIQDKGGSKYAADGATRKCCIFQRDSTDKQAGAGILAVV